MVTGVRRRRNWSDEEKLRFVAQTYEPGLSVSEVARRNDLSAGLLFTWKRMAEALRSKPKSAELLLVQAILRHRLGQTATVDVPLDAAVSATRDAALLNRICYEVHKENVSLDRALSACGASLRLRADDANTLDSRAFVLMRMGRNAEALAAYDAALAKDPKLSASLYGRGLVEARLGRGTEAKRDTELALAARPNLRDEFAEIGMR